MNTITQNALVRVLCPACGSRMRIRTGKAQAQDCKPMYAKCANGCCGKEIEGAMRWVAPSTEPEVANA